jgi:hypothetical protein
MKPMYRTTLPPVDVPAYVERVLQCGSMPLPEPPDDLSEDGRRGWEGAIRETAALYLLSAAEEVRKRLRDEKGEPLARVNPTILRSRTSRYPYAVARQAAELMCELSGGGTSVTKGRGRKGAKVYHFSHRMPTYPEILYTFVDAGVLRSPQWIAWKEAVDAAEKAKEVIEREQAAPTLSLKIA